MKKIYNILFIALSLPISSIYAQDEYQHLDINNIKVPLFSRGNLFRESLHGSHGAEFPSGSSSNVIFSQSLWFGGLDQNQELRIAGQKYFGYGLNGYDHFIGPVSQSTTPESLSAYNKVWKISKNEINAHISNYNNLSYTIPTDILTWPAHGDVSLGEAQNLAPFVDVNQNGIYEPYLGDYPKIRGDQALFAIFNDANKTHSEFNGQKVHAEVHVMLYGYEDPYVDFLDNSFFVHYEIYNRSENLSYSNFYISQYIDHQLGYYMDNYIGTHVSKNIIYAYNGDNYDESSIGYGAKPPVFGWVLLNQDYTSTMSHYNDLSKNGIPINPSQVYNAMQGLYNDTTSMVYASTTTPTKFIYPGNTNPLFSDNWTEPLSGNEPESRRTTASTVVYDFGPGDKICLDYAGVFSRDNTPDYNHQINQLFADVDGVQSVYDYENFDCNNQVLTVNETPLNALSFFVKDHTLMVNRPTETAENFQIHIVNSLGKILLSSTLKPSESQKAIDISHLPSGIYFIPNHNFKFVKS